MKKISAFLLAVLMITPLLALFSSAASDEEVWDGSIATSFASGKGTAADPYIIETPAQLAYFSKVCNEYGYYGFPNSHIKLANNICLNDTSDWENWETNPPENSWKPITPFYGTFDGNNKVITGIYINSSSDAGLFGCADDATIKNVVIKESYIRSGYRGGAVAGYCDGDSGTRIINCTNYATVSSSSAAGGIVGAFFLGSITDCSNLGTVKIVGASANDSFESRAGGIVGTVVGNLAGDTSVSRCFNGGKISGEYGGGIAGYASDHLYNLSGGNTGHHYLKIENCYNYGDINSTLLSGGLVGYLTYSSNYFSRVDDHCVQYSYNVGKIEGENKCGQIIGNILGAGSSGLSTSYFYSDIYYCNMFGSTQYAIGTLTSSYGSLTPEQAQQKGSYKKFDFNNVWVMSTDEAYPYPVLFDNPHKDMNTHFHSHALSATVQPTCTEEGVKTYTCDECGDYYTKAIPALGHDMVIDNEVLPDCTNTGLTEGSHCSRCDYKIEQGIIPAYNHIYEFLIDESEYPESAHNYANNTNQTKTFSWQGAKKLSITFSADTKVEETYDKIYLYDGENSLIGEYTGSSLAEQTLTITGDTFKIKLTSDNSVSHFGYSFTSIIAYMEGRENWEIITEPDCLNNGVKKSVCAFCAAEETSEIPALGHDIVIVNEAVDATCTQTGLTAGQHCSRCDDATVEHEVIPALGHDYDYTKSESNLIRPTETADGYYIFTCKNGCNITETETVKRADYTAYDELISKLESYLTNENLTDKAKQEISAAIENLVQNNKYHDDKGVFRADLTEEEQTVVDSAASDIREIVADIEEKIASDEFVKADYSEIEEKIGEIEKKLENSMISDELGAEFDNIKAELDEIKKDIDASQADVNEAVNSLIDRLEGVLSAINNCENGIHSFTNYVTIKEANCISHGIKTAECNNGCGASDEVKIPELGHDIIIDEAVDATCTTTGLTEGQRCSRCDDATVDQEIVPIKSHDYVVKYDSAKHWKECSCEAKTELQNHSFVGGNVCSCGYIRATIAEISIKNNTGSKTIKYGETLKLTAIVTNKPADAKICWYVDGVKKGEGEVFDVSFESGTKIITVKLVDSNGVVYHNASGNEVSDSENVTVNAGFFQKIISFFKNLFRMNRTIVQVFRVIY